MRLDHLLSKEHHEIQARPRPWEFGDLDDSLDGPVTCSGWGSGATQQTFSVLSRLGGAGLPDTLLGFETTGPAVLLRWWVLPAVSP